MLRLIAVKPTTGDRRKVTVDLYCTLHREDFHLATETKTYDFFGMKNLSKFRAEFIYTLLESKKKGVFFVDVLSRNKTFERN